MFYAVEKKYHHLSINDKPIFEIDYTFFLDRKEASKFAKQTKEKFFYKSQLSSAKIIKITKESFKWVTCSKHTAIMNDVVKHYVSIRGELNKKIHPNTGNLIFIDQQYPVEIGLQFKEILEK